MLSQDELLAWYQQQNVSSDARLEVNRVRSSGPFRRVGGGGSNVSGRYPSRKMGVAIQFESHRVELAFVREMEHDSDVLEFYDQPPSFLLDYKTAKGRHVKVLHTPDFFVLRTAEAGWEECKTEEELEKLSEKSPNRYCQDERGTWRCPPGVAHASELGLYYRVRSSREINWVLQRNLQFLEDYLCTDSRQGDRKGWESGLAIVSAEPGIRLSELVRRAAEVMSRDDVYALIATRELFVDLGTAPLAEPERVRVFTNREAAVACGHVVQSVGAATDNYRGFSVRAGHTIAWDGRTWMIVNPGEKTISLLGEDEALTELPVSVFEELTKQGRIQGPSAQQEPGPRPEIAVLASASESDLSVANGRLDAVLGQLRGDPPFSNGEVSARTLRLWVSRYRKAEACFGSGYLGLLPRGRERGNRSNRLPVATRALLLQAIENDYETLKQKTRLACWAALKRGCDDSGIMAPSYATFCAAVRRRNKFTQVLKRQGRRAAYQHEPPYWELERKTPRHGDRPFEIAHVDHTQLDVEVICSQTGRALGRPWLTLVTDAFSRRVLAVYLTFDAPSYRSCMMALRECVRRHAHLPQTLVVDGGREFSSAFFEGLLARYECTKKTRPPAKARFGSLVERLFGTFVLQNRSAILWRSPLCGARPGTSRQVLVLCQYFYSIYDTADHPALGQSPREAYRLGLERTGYRLVRLIAYDQSFLMSTLPTTPKGSAKVQPRQGCQDPMCLLLVRRIPRSRDRAEAGAGAL